MSGEGLPWRPMTISELLDAAVAVLRHRPARLLAAATVLAVIEQLILFPLRGALVDGQHDYMDDLAGLHDNVWTVIAAGMGTEAFAIGMLGAIAAGSARAALLAASAEQPKPSPYRSSPSQPQPSASRAAPSPPWTAALPGSPRLFGATVLSLFVALGAVVTFWAGAVLWVFWFMFTALVTPALVNDAALGPRAGGQPGKRLSVPGAFVRSFALVGRAGLRPGGVRLLTYLIFTIMRLLIAWVGLRVIPGFIPLPLVAEYSIWVLVNATMYAYIACGDAAVHLETRIRLEGLDIELSRAARLGMPVADALAVPR